MLLNYLGKFVVRIFDLLVWISTKNEPFPDDPSLAPYRALEQYTAEFRAEFLQLQQHLVTPVSDIFVEQKKIADADTWQSYMLTMFGYRINEHLEACPFTARMIQDGRISSAMFSVLKAGTSIKPHKGIFKGVIRAHLGLIVPEGECYIKVDGRSYSWKEGEMVFLDDTFLHEAVNNTDQDRVVLFLDIIRPLPFPLALANRLMLRGMGASVFIQNIFRQLSKERPVSTSRMPLTFR
jgi:beta-hydroxylase